MEAAATVTSDGESVAALQRALGALCHDLNNLLYVAVSNTEFLISDLGDGHASCGDARAAHRASTDAVAVLKRLAIFSARRPMQADTTRVDLVAFVQEQSASTRLRVGDAIRVDVVAGDNAADARVNASDLAIVLSCLIDNAIEAMPTGGVLTLGVTRQGGCVGLTVHDTGIGMAFDAMARAFEPFVTTKPRRLGVGLGLSIVSSLTHAAGGFAELRSEPSRGTTATAYFSQAAVRA